MFFSNSKNQKITQFLTSCIDKSSSILSRISNLFKLKSSEPSELDQSHVNLNLVIDNTANNNTYEELPENSVESLKANSEITGNYSSSVQYEEIGFGCQNDNNESNRTDNDFYLEIQKPAEREYKIGKSEKIIYSGAYQK